MTRAKRILQAIDEAARIGGKTRAEVFTILAPTLQLEPGELLAVRQAMQQPVPAASPAAVVVNAARTRADEFARERDAAAVDAWRQYSSAKTVSPFRAAQMMNTNSAAIFRGRDLDTEPNPEPPKAA
jgi:hypothetical protein